MKPVWKTIWRCLKKLKIELPYVPAIPYLGIYRKIAKLLIRKNTCLPMFIPVLFTIDKIWKKAKCPSMDDGHSFMSMNDVVDIHIYNGILSQKTGTDCCHLQEHRREPEGIE